MGAKKQIRAGKILLRVSLAASCAGLMMGNEGCEEVQSRQLRRRVSMGKVEAPQIQLPSNMGTFDFKYVANAQMYSVLKRTQTFSTSTIDPLLTYSAAGLDDSEAANFNQCMDPEELEDIKNGVARKTVISERAACLIDLPQGVVSGNVLDFRLKSGAGLTLGLADIPLLQALSFDFKKYEFAMVMNVMDPLIVNHNIAATAQQTFGKEMKVAASLNFSGFNLGPSFYYNSPLRQVVEEGMTEALKDLKKQWDVAHPWYGMVLRNCDKSIYINAGNATDAGLVVGDVVKVSNVKYRWAGEVCGSQLLGTTPNTEVVAYARITSVGDTMAVATVIDNNPEKYPYSLDQIIKPGSRVYMHEMYVDPATKTKKKN